MSEAELPERIRTMPDEPASISQLNGVLSEDGNKVKVTIELTNGSTHPDLELTLKSAENEELSHTTILENFGPRMVFSMHIRQARVKYPLKLTCKLSYLDDSVFSQAETLIENQK
jgi:hypothetical protein